jgi:outer membrane murein-binding lipoprotein Lpp
MARPDDDHVPRAILGDDGEVLAVAHVSRDAGPEVTAALRGLADAVRRMDERVPEAVRVERAARQEAARARDRARLERIRGHGP